MNYQLIYDNLINKRKITLTEGYTEKHHILPRCMNGTNEESNLVALTAREHFIAHLLLVKIYNHKSLIYAANMMSNFKKYNSKHYEWLKIKFSFIISKDQSNRTLSEETKRKIGEASKRKVITEEFRQKMSKLNKGRVLSEERKKQISESKKGRKHSEETKRKMSDARKGKPNCRKGTKISEETRQKMSEAGFKRKHSDESKLKMIESWKLRKLKYNKEKD